MTHDVLADSNPVRDTEADDARLAALRMVVDTRRLAEEIRPRTVRTRRFPVLVGVTAAAIAVPLALPVVAPSLWESMTGRAPETAPLVDAAIAADGSLRCGDGSGYDDPIRPDRSNLRLWPTRLPHGWKVVGVSATSNTSRESCYLPSLVASDVAADGLVRGRVWVVGPARGIATDPGVSPDLDTVDGREAHRFTGLQPDTYSWLWSDDDGRQWYATVTGYPLDRARAAMAAVGTDGDQVTWRAGAAPGLRVMHRRTGTPYPQVNRSESWMIWLTDGERERTIAVDTGRDRPMVSAAAVGMRIEEEAGRTLLLSGIGEPWPEDQDRLAYEPLPGAWAQTDTFGDDGEMRKLLAGLRQVPADDPRLDRYAKTD